MCGALRCFSRLKNYREKKCSNNIIIRRKLEPISIAHLCALVKKLPLIPIMKPNVNTHHFHDKKNVFKND